MHTSLIIARVKPGSENAIGNLFAASDATELPDRVGVVERRLFTFHDLYIHMVVSEEPLNKRLTPLHDTPLFQSISKAMDEYVTPYEGAWGSVDRASASQFYHWRRGAGVVQPEHLRQRP